MKRMSMENVLVWEGLPVVENGDGTVKHIVKEGSRQHVVHWDTLGAHCSEPRCEINRKERKR